MPLPALAVTLLLVSNPTLAGPPQQASLLKDNGRLVLAYDDNVYGNRDDDDDESAAPDEHGRSYEDDGNDESDSAHGPDDDDDGWDLPEYEHSERA